MTLNVVVVWTLQNGVLKRIGQTDRTPPAPPQPPGSPSLTLPATLPATFA